MRSCLVPGVLICLMAAPSRAALAGDCEPTAELAGENLEISTGLTTNLGGISVVYNSVDDNYMIAWFDSRIVGQNDVYAQRIAPDGATLGDNVEISSGPASQTGTAIAHNTVDNEFLIAWQAQPGDPGDLFFNYSFGRVVDAIGSPITDDFDISNGGLEATLTYNPANNEYFLEARNFAAGGTRGIRGEIISPDGVPLTGGITIATAGAPAPAGQVAYNPNANEYLATWRDQVDADLRAQRIDGDGNLLGGVVIVSETFPGSSLASSIAFDVANDQYLVVFATFSGGPVIGQFIGSDGALRGANFTIVEDDDTLQAFVAFDAVNRVYLVSWLRSPNVRARLLSENGDLLGGAIPVVNGTATALPRVAADTDHGGFLIAWRDDRNVGRGMVNTYAQIVSIIGCDVEGDLDGDGAVGTGDLIILLGLWGRCADCPDCPADFDGDCMVGATDLITLLGNWG